MVSKIADMWWRALPAFPITMEAAMRLPEYSATIPTGVIPMKTWRRRDGLFDRDFRAAGGTPRWVICRYVASEPEMHRGEMVEMCEIKMYRAVIRVKMGRHVCA